MPKKQGKCINIDCDNYKQIVEVETGEDFECPLCHQHLEEVGGSDKKKDVGKDKSKGKLIAIIAAAVVVLAGIGAAVFFLTGDKKPTKIQLNKTELVMTVGEKDVIVPTAEPEGVKVTFVFKKSGNCVEVNSGGEVTAAKKGEGTIIVKCEENPELRAVCKVTVKEPEVAEEPKPQLEELAVKEEPAEAEKKPVQTGESKVSPKPAEPQNGYVSNYNLGYGTYTGDIKNGKPHGHGTIIYRSSHAITSSIMASPGDKYEGDFRDGRVSGGIGYWTHNGNMKTINP